MSSLIEQENTSFGTIKMSSGGRNKKHTHHPSNRAIFQTIIENNKHAFDG
jgi:hypothetical protein